MQQVKSATKVEEQETAPQSVSFSFDNQSPSATKAMIRWLGRSYLMLSLLALLLAVLYWVIFTLPAAVTEPDVSRDTTIIEKKPSKPLTLSPWRDAQLAKYRRESQTILAKVLKKQALLEGKHVELWASNQFMETIKSAESGDLYYRNQEFALAIKKYNQSLAQLNSLEKGIPTIFNSYLEQGQLALATNNSQKAIQQLTIALYLRPQEPVATLALDQAKVLDRVMELVKAGIELVDEQQLDTAKLTLNQAFSLDNNSTIVNEQLTRVNKLIRQRDYSAAMSNGYNLMNHNQYQQAIKHFRLAQKIAPSANDPKVAIQQSKNQQTKAKIALNMNQAKTLEHQEAWSTANLKYRQALSMDSTLMAARLGQLRSLARQQLDQQLRNIIDKPQRLTDEAVYQQAQETYNNALKTKQPGNRLLQQLAEIKQLLIQVRLPVALRIESDNLTQVILYQVGALGNFAAKNLNLKPGEYTVIGSRNGYRDVRQQFTLQPNSQLKTIIVQCNQKVTNG